MRSECDIHANSHKTTNSNIHSTGRLISFQYFYNGAIRYLSGILSSRTIHENVPDWSSIQKATHYTQFIFGTLA